MWISQFIVVKIYYEQECIPVGCIPPTHYHMGGLHDRDPPDRDPLNRDPFTETPQQSPWTETPWIETLPHRDPRQRHPGQRPPDRDPPRQRPLGQRTPSHVTYGACWDRDPPVNRITDACKNITLPQLCCGR